MSDDFPTASMYQHPDGESRDGSPNPGDMIGQYKLLESIAEGGFGEVWLAERRGAIVQRVALKIIKAGMDTKAVIARFEQERQALAVMDHPNVAKVFDAGATPTGRPYFVMEHVPGESITAYADRQNLSVRERLELFIPVCEAIQHAHHKGIIHRDIKPSNILVAVRDGRPVPKIIDFGVAKAVARTLTDKTIFTETGQLIGTPEYMSPEQAEMGATDIDTRTDVYSLGVVLYELLSGLLPFDSKSLRAAGYDAICKVLREQDAPKPSTRLSSVDNAIGAEIAHHRVIEREHLASQLRRELDWIPLKALRKDRTARYDSPADLAKDIRRYLDGEALDAGPESTGYRMRKFVRRNKGAVIAAGVITASLMLSTGVSVWFGLRESAARQREREQRLAAEIALTRAESVTAFVTKVLKSSDPSMGGRQNTTVVDAMRSAIKEVEDGAFRNDPEVEADLRNTIAAILANNGLAEQAEPLCVKALEMRRRLFEGDHPDIAATLNNLATIRNILGRRPDAELLYVQALEMDERLYKANRGGQFTTAGILSNLANVRAALGRPEEAEPLLAKVLAIYQRPDAYGEGDNVKVAEAMINLGAARRSVGRAAESESLLVQALEMNKRLHASGGGDHPDVAANLSHLAFTLNALNRQAEAEPLLMRSLEMRQRLYGGDHQDVAQSFFDLGDVRAAQHHEGDAESSFLLCAEMRRRLFKDAHPDLVLSLNSLGAVRCALGKFSDARPVFDEAIALERQLSPQGSPILSRILWRSGRASLDMGDATGALPQLEEAATLGERLLPPDSPRLKEYRETLARCKVSISK